MPLQSQAVIDIARRAGEAILDVYRAEELSVSIKEDRSPVTEADRRADRVIIEGLKAIDPERPILTEEAAKAAYEERKEWASFWLVDPLDGTKEFIKRSGEFTVNIALIERGEPIMGVVWAPAIELLYWGERGQGAYCRRGGEEKRIETRKAEPSRMALVASKDHAGPQVEALKESYPGSDLKSMGSSLKLCLVAEGAADLYLRDGPTSEWDTGAAHAIVEEAGGIVVEWLGRRGGQKLRYNKENLRNPQFLVQGDPNLEVELSSL